MYVTYRDDITTTLMPQSKIATFYTLLDKNCIKLPCYVSSCLQGIESIVNDI